MQREQYIAIVRLFGSPFTQQKSLNVLYDVSMMIPTVEIHVENSELRPVPRRTDAFPKRTKRQGTCVSSVFLANAAAFQSF